MRPSPRLHDLKSRSRRGFTLMELMIVILIIVLLSAAMIPTILPALNARRVSEGSRLLQSELARQRDLAIRANAPRGIRLLPDPFDPARPNVLTSSRLLALETGPDYDDGIVEVRFDEPPYAETPPNANRYQYYAPPPGLPPFIISGTPTFTNNTTLNPGLLHYPYLIVRQDKAYQPPVLPAGTYLPNPPTSWFYNIRQGEKLRFQGSGRVFTVAGPITNPGLTVPAFANLATPGIPEPNPDRFINYGSAYVSQLGANTPFDFLMLTNGTDDDGDGYVDEGFDGIDNDGDGIVDPGFNGRDDNGDGHIDEPAELYLHATGPNGTGPFIYPGIPPTFGGYNNGGFPPFLSPGVKNSPLPNEYEEEDFGTLRRRANNQLEYKISRRPVPVEGAREISMPTNVVIDLTTWDADILFGQQNVAERSRLPVDPYTGFVDVMVAPNGQIVVAGASANASPPVNFPYYHFWITERDDVNQPTPKDPANGKTFLLPMPKDAGNDPRIAGVTGSPALNSPVLRYERRLLSVNTRTGSIVPTAIETFYLNNPSFPFEAAESGQRDAQQ